ncbi:MAG: hypothetical protein AABO57_03305 [Acidobacteriota bacterium]
MSALPNKKRVLLLCTGNSCRSQMAEGWLRELAGDEFEVSSAGTNPTSVNPMAVRVMAELTIDRASDQHLCKGEISQEQSYAPLIWKRKP